MTDDKTVLMVGGTGALGGQVVSTLLARGKRIRALVRPNSNATSLQRLGVEIARGDMMDPPSLLSAMEGADAVITTAAGYTRHSPADTVDTDTIGNRNLVDAAAQIGVRRFVLTSVLTCDQTPQVPRFWHKKLVEDHLAKRGVPYVSLRPGAFLEGINRNGTDPFTKGRLIWPGSASIPMTFVLAADLAGYLADSVDAPGVEGQHIDIGWDRPMSVLQLARMAGEILGRPIRVRTVPGSLFNGVSAAAGVFSPRVKDIGAMIRWFQTGRYVADPTRQHEVFGEVPSAEDAIARFAAGLRGLQIT
jgi:uncharacterized protein YbjT (DUF2867 family)